MPVVPWRSMARWLSLAMRGVRASPPLRLVGRATGGSAWLAARFFRLSGGLLALSPPWPSSTVFKAKLRGLLEGADSFGASAFGTDVEAFTDTGVGSATGTTGRSLGLLWNVLACRNIHEKDSITHWKVTFPNSRAPFHHAERATGNLISPHLIKLT